MPAPSQSGNGNLGHPRTGILDLGEPLGYRFLKFETRMKILFVASEGLPYSKTGGLADVVEALPKALAQMGNEVAVLLPRGLASLFALFCRCAGCGSDRASCFCASCMPPSE